MRDRLKKLILENDILCHTCGENTDSYCAEYLAEYLIENGVIVPPCKVGDTVWFELYGQTESAVIYHCTYELSHRGCLLSGAYAKDTRGLELSFNANSIGKAVFLTREEAERALKGEHNAEIH